VHYSGSKFVIIVGLSYRSRDAYDDSVEVVKVTKIIAEKQKISGYE